MPEKHFSGKYMLVKLLNHGEYSKVYHAKDTRTGQSVAIKAVQDYQQGLVEIQALTRLNHRHVIKLVEVLAAADSDQVFIVTEFAKCGDLFEMIADRGRLAEDVGRHYFHQLISAVRHCHARGVFHRDIKPENLLLDDKWALKLSDFGLCSVSDPGRPGPALHEPCGTPEYAAPEVLAGRGYDGAKADVWSCGVVLYVLTAGFLPFDGAGMWGKMRKGEFRLPSWMSPGLKWLLRRILDPNPETRMTIDEILEDGWFRKDWSDEAEEDEEIAEDDSGSGTLPY